MQIGGQASELDGGNKEWIADQIQSHETDQMSIMLED